MAAAVEKGIAPSKDITSKLKDDQITRDTLWQARTIARETNKDTLEEKQKNMIKHKKLYDKMVDNSK